VTRASDVVARVGGDEFVVLFPETGTAPARLAIEKVRQAVSGIVPAHGWRLSASIGVATYLVAPESVDVLVGTADHLMSAAKRSARPTPYRIAVADSQRPVGRLKSSTAPTPASNTIP